MLKKLWINLAYNSITILVKKIDNSKIEVIIKKVLEVLKKLVAVLTDNNPSDTEQALELWREERINLAVVGIDTAFEIIAENSSLDETIKEITKEAINTIKKTLQEAEGLPIGDIEVE